MAARIRLGGGKGQDKRWSEALRMAVMVPGASGKTKLREVAEVVVGLALAGDLRAAQEIGDRLDGRPHVSADIAVNRPVNEMSEAELLAVIATAVPQPKNTDDDAGPGTVH